MTHDEMIDAIRADQCGEPVQMRERDTNRPWLESKEPMWNFSTWDYRRKPKPRVAYVVFNSAGFVVNCYISSTLPDVIAQEGLRDGTIVKFVEVVE